LILVAWKVHPRFDLVVAANRDELRSRPSEPIHWWPDRDVLAGRDEKAGGTWLAVSRDGRMAAVTNYREPGGPSGERSRGEIPLLALAGAGAAIEDPSSYAGFHLVYAAADELWHASNRGEGPTLLQPGFHAISNGPRADVWPKMRSGLRAIAPVLDDADALLAVLDDRATAPDAELPHTGVPSDVERALSARFIDLPWYGTRASTVMHRSAEEVRVVELTRDPGGSRREERWPRAPSAR
jgi:uncharacterized protein with NRDE domain